MAPNNYDPIATNYDWLSRLVFGRKLVKSQTCLLPHIPAGSKILIVGGGTGWILTEISRIHHSGLIIHYVEISAKMIELAKKCEVGKNEVIFVNQTIEDYLPDQKFDVIFTAFLFDNFKIDKAELVFEKLYKMLNPGGKWLFADFYLDRKSKLWQKSLLFAMLNFFRFVCKIEARNLLAMQPFFQKKNFNQTHQYNHFHAFIRSYVYKKMAE